MRSVTFSTVIALVVASTPAFATVTSDDSVSKRSTFARSPDFSYHMPRDSEIQVQTQVHVTIQHKDGHQLTTKHKQDSIFNRIFAAFFLGDMPKNLRDPNSDMFRHKHTKHKKGEKHDKHQKDKHQHDHQHKHDHGHDTQQHSGHSIENEPQDVTQNLQAPVHSRDYNDYLFERSLDSEDANALSKRDMSDMFLRRELIGNLVRSVYPRDNYLESRDFSDLD
ncbi:hypothetical protein C8Q75DRAFT_806565 [Abortiporus biennis]|nr:hypothetical protein C8Q75DRAFT_806565 [Abortiporus biennis]